jgi:hypothetical protein
MLTAHPKSSGASFGPVHGFRCFRKVRSNQLRGLKPRFSHTPSLLLRIPSKVLLLDDSSQLHVPHCPPPLTILVGPTLRDLGRIPASSPYPSFPSGPYISPNTRISGSKILSHIVFVSLCSVRRPNTSTLQRVLESVARETRRRRAHARRPVRNACACRTRMYSFYCDRNRLR